MISRKPESSINFDGRTYHINLAFDNVLRVFELKNDPVFDENGRIALSVEMLAGRNTARLPARKRVELLQLIFDRFISIKSNQKSDGGPKVVDFTQDAQYIYSSFLMDYGIDLIAEQGRLDWRKFVALFKGLSSRTKIREIMSIRAKEIPEPTKYNAKEIAALMEAKAYYALKISDEEAEQRFQLGVDRLASGLEARAKAGG